MKTTGQVVKLSASDIPVSVNFYTEVLGFTVDARYTLTRAVSVSFRMSS